MASLPQISVLNAIIALLGIWLASKFSRSLRHRSKTTQLNGPASKSWFFGVQKLLGESKDAAIEYENWAEEFGPAYHIPILMGGQKLVLQDPKGISHFYSQETFTYVHHAIGKEFIKHFVGKGVLWADGESHRRQRKALTPAFSNAAIRKLTPVFFDSAYRVKEAWDALLDSSSNRECIIDVQDWMNHVSLDSVGRAGFSHNFGTLEGNHSAIADVFDEFGKSDPTFTQLIIFILSSAFPILLSLPSSRGNLIKQFSKTSEDISKELLERNRKESEMGGKIDHSVIGLLIKAENEKAELRMSEEEVMAQMKVLILAGYETTSISLTWALIELSKNPEMQSKLREELLSQFTTIDPTYDQLTTNLPYLDGVVHEVLRLHPPVPEANRMAVKDDIIPLSAPIRTADNKLVDRISIAAGQSIIVPMRAINRSTDIWGPDAKEFIPQRWIDEGGIPAKAKEVQGHRHLLTFVDGPRTCLGKSFALAEFKAVLSTLVRNYTFELRDGPDTKFDKGRSILPRPKVAGEDGCKVPLRVRRVD